MPSWLSTAATQANIKASAAEGVMSLTSTTVNSAAGVATAGLNAGSQFSTANIPNNTTQTIINSQLNGATAQAIGGISGLSNGLLNRSQLDAIQDGGFNYLQESGALKLDNILGELAAGSPAGDLGGLINDNIDLGVFGGLTQQETTDIMNSINSSISAIKSPGDFVKGFGFDKLNNIVGGFSDIGNFIQETINVIPKDFNSILGAVGGEFDVLRELIEDIEDRSGISLINGAISGAPSKFNPNPLREYNSHNYVITFGIMNADTINNPELLRQDSFTKVIARTGGGMYDKRHQIPVEKEIGGHAEYFIDNLQTSAVISPNQKTGIALGTDLSFEITEPYSMGNFLQSVVESAKDLGYKNYSEAVYGIKIEFTGYDEQLNITNLVTAPAYIPVKILNIEFDVSGAGSVYSLKDVPYSEVALSDEAAETKMDINVVGSTVSDLLSGVDRSVMTVINQRIDGLEDSGAIPNQSGDRYIIAFPKDPAAIMKIVNGEISPPDQIQITAAEQLRREKGLAELPEDDPRKQESLDAVKVPSKSAIFTNLENYCRNISFMNEIGLSLMVPDDNQGGTAPSPDLSASYNEEGVADTTAGEMTVAEKAREKSFSSGSRIDEIIEKVLVDSEYAAENAAEISENGIRKLYRINTHVFQDTNPEAEKIKGRPPLVFVYAVVPFYTDDASFQPPNGVAANRGGIRQAATKEYNYIYTGKNEDVLDFNINFNNAFLQEAYANFGMNPGASASGGSDRKTFQNTGDQKGASTSKADSGDKSSAGGTTTERTEFAITGDSRTTDIRKRLAETFHHRFLNNNVDMLSASLNIWGDPFYLPTQTGNYIADRASGTPSVTEEGYMTYLENDVYVIVNFSTPVDYSIEGDNILRSQLVPEFSGIYRVLSVQNSFNKGQFTQSLELLRSRGQEDEGEPGTFVEINDDVAVNTGPGTQPTTGDVGGNEEGGNNDSPCESPLDLLPKVGDKVDRVITGVFPEIKKLANIPSLTVAGVTWSPPESLFAAIPSVRKADVDAAVTQINNATDQAVSAVNSITGIKGPF